MKPGNGFMTTKTIKVVKVLQNKCVKRLCQRAKIIKPLLIS